jgi:hypothetical protein
MRAGLNMATSSSVYRSQEISTGAYSSSIAAAVEQAWPIASSIATPVGAPSMHEKSKSSENL